MGQTLGDQIIVAAVLIIVMMTVLGWVESARWRRSAVHHQRHEPGATRRPDERAVELLRRRGRPAPGRKTA